MMTLSTRRLPLSIIAALVWVWWTSSGSAPPVVSAFSASSSLSLLRPSTSITTGTRASWRVPTRTFLSSSSAAADPGLSSAQDKVSKNSQQTTPPVVTTAAEWHRQRRREMLQKYGDQIAPLERTASSQMPGVPLLAVACTGLWSLALWSGSLPLPAVVALAMFPGSMFSLWQLQLLHDVIHGCFLPKGQAKVWGMPRNKVQDAILFWGSLPCIFGYYLYLQAGHLSHHQNAGQHDLAQVFESSARDFEDGDVLFVAHRMHMTGDYGPKIPLPGDGNEFKMSISKSGFYFWEMGQATRNAIVFCTSFLFERVMLGFNDFIVALTGTNWFFRHKPRAFHDDCARYARVATALRAGLWFVAGWKTLLFLYLSESLWSLPPHPACAMFITNHGSNMDDDNKCVPTRSTYAGRWYSMFTLSTNLHCEHHDFPTIPFHKLHLLRKIAPEYYRSGSNDNLWTIMKTTFAQPEFYACMNANEMFADASSPSRSATIYNTSSGDSDR